MIVIGEEKKYIKTELEGIRIGAGEHIPIPSSEERIQEVKITIEWKKLYYTMHNNCLGKQKAQCS